MPAIRLFISTWKKSYEDVYHSALHVSATTRNMKITIIRFTCYHLLLSSNSTFMTKSLNLGTIQIWRDELMDTAIKSVICQIANCSPFHSIHTSPLICSPNQETGFYMITASVLKRLKLIYYGLISNFSKYYFKTGAICSFSYLHMYLPF